MGMSGAMPLMTKRLSPTGGVMSPVSTTMSTMMPNQIAVSSGLRPRSSDMTMGKKIGMVRRIMESESMRQPKTR